VEGRKPIGTQTGKRAMGGRVKREGCGRFLITRRRGQRDHFGGQWDLRGKKALPLCTLSAPTKKALWSKRNWPENGKFGRGSEGDSEEVRGLAGRVKSKKTTKRMSRGVTKSPWSRIPIISSKKLRGGERIKKRRHEGREATTYKIVLEL